MTDFAEIPAPLAPLPFDVVGFDLDGTLLETAPDIANALNHALRLAGRPALPLAQVRPLIGGGVRILLRRALEEGGSAVPDGEFEELHDALIAYYRAHIAVDTHGYDGMVDALDALAERGIALGVATNKLEGLARPLLEQMGLAHRFASIVGGDTLGTGPDGEDRKKPLPDMLQHMAQQCGGGRVAFVGDSAFDIRAARAAGMPSVAVSFGYPGMPPEKLGADALIGHYRELIPALATLAR